MRLKLGLLTTILGGAFLLGAVGCDVDQTEQGSLPDVDVEGGNLPKYDVDGPEVDISTKEKTVTVPDVDVKTKEKTVTIPDVDVSVPDDDN